MSDHDAILEAKLRVIDETHRYVSGKSALLIIDMQHGFIDEGASLEVAAARDIIPNLSKLIEAFREASSPVKASTAARRRATCTLDRATSS